MNHCSFCLQWCQVLLVRKGSTSLLPEPWLWPFPPFMLPLSETALCVIYWAWFSGAGWRTFEWCLLGSHWNPSSLISVGNQNPGSFWSFPISPCVFWLPEIPVSFLGLGQHLSFLLCRTPSSICVTLCQRCSSRGGPELGLWPYVLFSVLHCLRVCHIYTVIVYSLVPENSRGQGQLEWFKVSHFIQRMEQRGLRQTKNSLKAKALFIYSSMFDETNRLIFVVPVIHYSLFILSVLLCGLRHEDPLEWILVTPFCGDRHCDSVARQQRLSSLPGIPVEEWASLSALPAWIVRGGGRWELGNVLGHCEDNMWRAFWNLLFGSVVPVP